MTEKPKKTGRGLERRVAQAYRNMGARIVDHDVELAGRQIDVYVELETPDRALHRIAIEAKDYASRVGIKIISEFSDIVDRLRRQRLIDEGVVVSANGFTRPARNAAKEHGIRLLEPADLDAAVALARSLHPLGDTLPVMIDDSKGVSDSVGTETKVSSNTVLSITYESSHAIRTELHLQNGQISSGLMPFDDDTMGQSLVAKLHDYPKLIFRYSTRDTQDYALTLGQELYNLTISQPVKRAVKTMVPSTVDLVVDPDLQYLPWELLHDENEFLCLKHAFGRRLLPQFGGLARDTSRPATYATQRSREDLRFLIIGVEDIGRDRELELITQTCKDANITPSILSKATTHAVTSLLYDGQDIVHWIGHASGNGLVLKDGVLDFEIIADITHQHRRECLFFLNVCETAVSGVQKPAAYNLALRNLTVVSPLTWIQHDLGIQTAGVFYEHVLSGGSFAESLRLAKRMTFIGYPTASWWAYILWGDPSGGIRTT